MRKSWLTKAMVALVLGLGLPACSTNQAATQQCEQAADCEACCKAAGATGHASSTVGGKVTCKCLGGGG